MTAHARSPKKPTRTKIFLVDDHPVLRAGIAILINGAPDLCVCGEAEAAIETLEKLPLANPDVVVVDISLPGTDGIGLIKQIKRLQPQCHMVVYSGNDEVLYAERVLAAGAQGYVMKCESPLNLLAAIRRIMAGEIVVGKEITARLLRRATGQTVPQAPSGLAKLSNREMEIFRLIGQECSRTAIAKQLQISVKTFEVHRAHIREKLNLANARALYMRAVKFHKSQASAQSS